MRALLVPVLAVAVLAVPAACTGGDDPDRATPTSTAPSAAPPAGSSDSGQLGYVGGECPEVVTVAPPASVECGTLTVPERHDRPSGPTVELPVATIDPGVGFARDDAVVYLDGGPGSDALSQVGALSALPVAGNHRIVVIGQRGSRFARPSLECPETDQVAVDQLDAELGTPDADREYLTAVGECAARLRERGVDLDAYDTAAAADDVEAARRALGHDAWNLYGVSYGTRLALEVARRHPDSVRSVVLDSAMPAEVDRFASLAPNARRAFAEVATACAQDPVCAPSQPELVDRLAALYERLEADPVDVSVPPPDGEGDRATVTVRWDGDRLMTAALAALYDSSLIPMLPRLLGDAERGELEAATVAYLEAGAGSRGNLAQGLHLAVVCREQAPFTDRAALDRQRTDEPAWVRASVSRDLPLASCDPWDAEPAEAANRTPVVVDAPLLVLAGRFDPTTPPTWGHAVADAGSGWFVEFPSYGHAVSFERCAREMVGWFVDDPATEPDRSCLVDVPVTPAWVLAE